MYQLETTLQNLTPADYLAVAKRTIQRLGWTLIKESPVFIIAETPIAWRQNYWGEMVFIEIENDIVSVAGKRKGNFPFDGGRNRENVHRYLETFSEVMVQPEEDNPLTLVKKKVNRRNARLKWWQVFVPSKYFYVTPVLLILNIGLFVESLVDGSDFLQPTFKDLQFWGGNSKSITGGLEQYWRLLSYMFVHAGIFQIAMNMLALAVIGLKLEPIIGSVRFAACYIGAGLIAGLTSYAWNDNLISAGASGAIFGLYGVLLVMLTTKMFDKKIRNILIGSIVLFIAFNIAYGFLYKVDHAANIGGLAGGILIGYLMYFLIRSQIISNAWMQGSTALAATIIALIIIIPMVKDPYRAFNRALKEFSGFQKEGMRFYELPKDTKDYAAIIHLHDISIPNWIRCKKELAKVDRLKLPPNLVERRKLLHQYVDLRRNLSQRYIDKLGEVTTKYDEEIADMEWVLENLSKDLADRSK